MNEPKFKFELGDIVRHATLKYASTFVQEEFLPAMILARSWNEELGGFNYPTYTVDCAAGVERGVSEFTLELVTRPNAEQV